MYVQACSYAYVCSVPSNNYWEVSINFFFANPPAGGRAEHQQRQPQKFEYVLLVAHRREHFRVFWTGLFIISFSQKRVYFSPH